MPENGLFKLPNCNGVVKVKAYLVSKLSYTLLCLQRQNLLEFFRNIKAGMNHLFKYQVVTAQL